MELKRIAVIGISGSGKSTYSRRLSALTGIPLYYMDQLFWKGNWELIPEEEYLKKHAELIQKDSWIIEGYVDEAMSERLKRADLIIYLDYSGWRAAWRIVKRWFMHRKVSRPELHEEALERFKLRTIWRVLRRHERIPTEAALKHIDPSKVRRFHSPKELESFTKTRFS